MIYYFVEQIIQKDLLSLINKINVEFGKYCGQR